MAIPSIHSITGLIRLAANNHENSNLRLPSFLIQARAPFFSATLLKNSVPSIVQPTTTIAVPMAAINSNVDKSIEFDDFQMACAVIVFVIAVFIIFLKILINASNYEEKRNNTKPKMNNKSVTKTFDKP